MIATEGSVGLTIADEEFSISAAMELRQALPGWLARFAPAGTRASAVPIQLDWRCRPGSAGRTPERPEHVRVRERAPGEIAIEGRVRGSYSVSARCGFVEDGEAVGALDCLVRLALSVALPGSGGLLLHGAAIVRPDGQTVAVCGASGAGKSTAARALGAACDELVVLRPAANGVEIYATPWWQGSPLRTRCAAVVCLARGREPGVARHRGADAARSLARNVVRYLALESVEPRILALVARVCERVPVATIACPEGDAFIPFLQAGLDAAGAAS